MCSSYNIAVDSLHVGLHLISMLVENFKGGLATYWSEVFLLEEGVLVIVGIFMLDDGNDQLSSYDVVSFIAVAR